MARSASFQVAPEDVGLRRADPAELKGGDPAHNAAALREVLEGKRNAYRDIAVFNAGAALVIAEAARDLADGVAKAQHALDNGARARFSSDLSPFQMRDRVRR